MIYYVREWIGPRGGRNSERGEDFRNTPQKKAKSVTTTAASTQAIKSLMAKSPFGERWLFVHSCSEKMRAIGGQEAEGKWV